MTIDQAVAILEAERVLQDVGAGGPDYIQGTAWHGYVKEASSIIKDDRWYCNAFNDLSLLKDYPEEIKIVYNFEALPEDTKVTENFSDTIIAELEAGNVWAWCRIKVIARIGNFEGTDYLSRCSYKNEEAFRQCDHFEDMKECALEDLRATLSGAVEALEVLNN